MYIPNANRVEDQTQLVAFMQANGFATLVSLVQGELFATHLPLMVVAEEEGVRLRGHLAKANPHWQAWATQPEVLVIFQGPHAYISPSHYEKWESVPTWNYIAVHAYGAVQLVQEEAGLLATLTGLIAATDPAYQAQWDSLPDKFRSGMLNGIVAFQITITRLEGKFKLSQNRPIDDQQRVATALANVTDTAIAATGHYMQGRLPV
jgi:transcriptional regulator